MSRQFKARGETDCRDPSVPVLERRLRYCFWRDREHDSRPRRTGFAKEGMQLEISRDLRDPEGRSALQATLVPTHAALAERVAVKVLRGEEEAQRFLKNIAHAGSSWETLIAATSSSLMTTQRTRILLGA